MIEYMDTTSEDYDEIADLAEKYLTHGSAIKEEIHRKDAEGRYFGVKAVEDGEIVGFYTYVDDCIEFTVPHPELEQRIAELAGDEKIITGDAIFISPNHQRRGIGMEVSRRVSEHARRRGGKLFITEAWVHPDGSIPSRKAFLCNGEVVFEETIPMFYQGLDQLGLECPICGKNCVCGAQIQVHRL